MISYLPLAQLMKQRNISFTRLKEITGRNDGALKKALCDGVYIKTSTLSAICDTLNCKIKDVVTYIPGPQVGLGSVKKVYINWDLLIKDFAACDSNMTKVSVEILGKSLNYLTVKKNRNSRMLFSELKTLADFTEKDAESYIIR